MEAFAVAHHRRKQEQVAPLLHFRLQAAAKFVAGLTFDGKTAIRTILRAQPGEQQAEEMINFGDGSDGALAATAAGALLDADRRRNAGDQIDVRPRKLLNKLPGVGIHRVEKTALAFGEKQVEGERALP